MITIIYKKVDDMLMFAFFSAVFASVSWLIYALLFVRAKIEVEGLWEQSPEIMLTLLLVIFLPILIIWAVFGYVNQFLSNRSMNVKQNELLKQLQKNQDYTDLVVRVMLDAEHEIKDGFVLNKFDLFINDMNEALGEIIQRCNIASSAQLDNLWQRVRRGERWILGKAVVEASKNQSTFDAWVKEKVNRDKVFRGALLEFCSRYQNLLLLLEKHDRDRVFIRMIESGVFGKVYSIIAPLSEGLEKITVAQPEKTAEPDKNDYASVMKIAAMEEEKIGENIINIDRNDNEEESVAEENDEEYEASSRFSFLSKLNPFRKKEEELDYDLSDEPDPFFQALHNSFRDEDETEREAPSFTAFSTSADTEETTEPEPSLSTEAPSVNLRPAFGNLQSTLESLRTNYNSATEPSLATEKTEPSLTATAENFPTPSLTAGEKTVTANSEDDEDLVYPFGGWTDEENYRK